MTPTITQPQIDLDVFTPEDRILAQELLKEGATVAKRIAKMGQLLVAMSPTGRDEFIAQFPPSSRQFWRRVHAVGEGRLYPTLATKIGRAAEYLGKLPLEEQARCEVELIPVAIVDERGRQDILRMDVEAMSSEIRAQVFHAVGPTVRLRSIDEQRAWLAEKARKAHAKEEREEAGVRIDRPDWTAEKGKIWPKASLMDKGITRQMLGRMLADLRA